MSVSFDSLLSEEGPGILHFGGARMALLDVEAGFWGLRRQLEDLVGLDHPTTSHPSQAERYANQHQRGQIFQVTSYPRKAIES